MAHVGGVEFPILQFGLNNDLPVGAVWNFEGIMNNIGRSRWNLMIVEGDKYILGVATVDATAVTVKHIGIHEM